MHVVLTDSPCPLSAQPDGTGLSMARALDEMGVPVTLVLDSGVAYCMGRCAACRAALRLLPISSSPVIITPETCLPGRRQPGRCLVRNSCFCCTPGNR